MLEKKTTQIKIMAEPRLRGGLAGRKLRRLKWFLPAILCFSFCCDCVGIDTFGYNKGKICDKKEIVL